MIRTRRALIPLSLLLLGGCTAAPSPTPDPTPAPTETTAPAASALADMLAALPEPDGDWVMVTFGDFTAVTSAGLDRPTETGDDLRAWLIATSGTAVDATVSVPWPESLGVVNGSAADGVFVESVGFDVRDVDAFLEVSVPPSQMLLVDGEFDLAAVGAALGDRVDGVWAQEGEDLRPDLANAGRPDQVGRPVRLAGDGSRLMMTLETGLAERYLAESGGAWDDLLPVAQALDAAGVYAAMFFHSDEGTVGVGLVLADGRSTAVAVRAHADAAAAEDAAVALEGVGDERVRIVDVEADGRVTVARLDMGDRPPGIVWDLLISRHPVIG